MDNLDKEIIELDKKILIEDKKFKESCINIRKKIYNCNRIINITITRAFLKAEINLILNI